MVSGLAVICFREEFVMNGNPVVDFLNILLDIVQGVVATSTLLHYAMTFSLDLVDSFLNGQQLPLF